MEGYDVYGGFKVFYEVIVFVYLCYAYFNI